MLWDILGPLAQVAFWIGLYIAIVLVVLKIIHWLFEEKDDD